MSTRADDVHEQLHAAGWSSGDIAHKRDGRLLWMVFAQHGEERIVARAETQTDAWRLACGYGTRLT